MCCCLNCCLSQQQTAASPAMFVHVNLQSAMNIASHEPHLAGGGRLQLGELGADVFVLRAAALKVAHLLGLLPPQHVQRALQARQLGRQPLALALQGEEGDFSSIHCSDVCYLQHVYRSH